MHSAHTAHGIRTAHTPILQMDAGWGSGRVSDLPEVSSLERRAQDSGRGVSESFLFRGWGWGGVGGNNALHTGILTKDQILRPRRREHSHNHWTTRKFLPFVTMCKFSG